MYICILKSYKEKNSSSMRVTGANRHKYYNKFHVPYLFRDENAKLTRISKCIPIYLVYYDLSINEQTYIDKLH